MASIVEHNSPLVGDPEEVPLKRKRVDKAAQEGHLEGVSPRPEPSRRVPKTLVWVVPSGEGISISIPSSTVHFYCLRWFLLLRIWT